MCARYYDHGLLSYTIHRLVKVGAVRKSAHWRTVAPRAGVGKAATPEDAKWALSGRVFAPTPTDNGLVTEGRNRCSERIFSRSYTGPKQRSSRLPACSREGFTIWHALSRISRD